VFDRATNVDCWRDSRIARPLFSRATIPAYSRAFPENTLQSSTRIGCSQVFVPARETRHRATAPPRHRAIAPSRHRAIAPAGCEIIGLPKRASAYCIDCLLAIRSCCRLGPHSWHSIGFHKSFLVCWRFPPCAPPLRRCPVQLYTWGYQQPPVCYPRGVLPLSQPAIRWLGYTTAPRRQVHPFHRRSSAAKCSLPQISRRRVR
jgi:hypothetical protein